MKLCDALTTTAITCTSRCMKAPRAPVTTTAIAPTPCCRGCSNMAEFQSHRLNAHPWQCASCGQRNSAVTFPRCELCESKASPITKWNEQRSVVVFPSASPLELYPFVSTYGLQIVSFVESLCALRRVSRSVTMEIVHTLGWL